ncbi:hypothetical protein F5Y03DRAFT_251432 [Xylaria venustula]|nr:hypothetical protein F5Y03DRAFT_251432 [Xylaria venustula]
MTSTILKCEHCRRCRMLLWPLHSAGLLPLSASELPKQVALSATSGRLAIVDKLCFIRPSQCILKVEARPCSAASKAVLCGVCTCEDCGNNLVQDQELGRRQWSCVASQFRQAER